METRKDGPKIKRAPVNRETQLSYYVKYARLYSHYRRISEKKRLLLFATTAGIERLKPANPSTNKHFHLFIFLSLIHI
jgi:hypothetical protein